MNNRPEPVNGIPRRATWMWRLSMLMSFAILGIATTLVIWWSAMRDSNRMAAATDMRPNREYHYLARERPLAPSKEGPQADKEAGPRNPRRRS